MDSHASAGPCHPCHRPRTPLCFLLFKAKHQNYKNHHNCQGKKSSYPLARKQRPLIAWRGLDAEHAFDMTTFVDQHIFDFGADCHRAFVASAVGPACMQKQVQGPSTTSSGQRRWWQLYWFYEHTTVSFHLSPNVRACWFSFLSFYLSLKTPWFLRFSLVRGVRWLNLVLFLCIRAIVFCVSQFVRAFWISRQAQYFRTFCVS